jgi:quinolinate synthase
MKKTVRDMILWQGVCVVHETFNEKKIIELKTQHPDAEVIAHPECEEAVLRHADFIGSTSKLLNYTKTSPAKKFIVLTESGILHQMRKSSPDKVFLEGPNDSGCQCNECPYMRLNTLEKLWACMKNEAPEIVLEENLRRRAYAPLRRMLELSAA